MVRLKNRYVLGELILRDGQSATEAKLNTKVTQQAIQAAVHEIHGDFGLGAVTAGFSVKYVGLQTNTVLIKVRHRAVKFLTSSLPFVQTIAKTPCCFQTLHIAGTIKACQKFLVKHDRRRLTVLYQSSKNQDEKNAVLASIERCKPKEVEWAEPLVKEEEDDYSDDDDS